MHSAPRTRFARPVRSVRGIFREAQVPAKNNPKCIRACGRELCEAIQLKMHVAPDRSVRGDVLSGGVYSVTVTVQEAVRPLSVVPVITASPGLTAVMMPRSSTVATPSSLLDQLTGSCMELAGRK